jgi:uncharacterized protein YjbJ (UPF0337 family)
VRTTPALDPQISWKGEQSVAKTGRRNQAEGTLDKIGGRVLEAWSKLTGNRSAGAKGKGARARGAGRSASGRAKQGGGGGRSRRRR